MARRTQASNGAQAKISFSAYTRYILLHAILSDRRQGDILLQVLPSLRSCTDRARQREGGDERVLESLGFNWLGVFGSAYTANFFDLI